MFKNLSLKTNILIVIAIVAFTVMLMIMLIAETIGRSHILENSFNHLKALREIKANQIENYINTNRNQVATFSQNMMVVDALSSFVDAYNYIPEEKQFRYFSEAEIQKSLKTYYEDQFLPKISPNIDRDLHANDFISSDPTTRFLQYLYVTSNPYPQGEHQKLTSIEVSSRYTSVHEKYHEIFKSYQEKFGYYDLFLVDSKTGDIVYSVFKEIDFATSLKSGPYSDTNLGHLFQQASKATYGGYVRMVDFEQYVPSYNAPASFVASPIFEGEENIGVLIFQMPIEKINEIMTYNYSWKDVGLGETGETYILGKDFKLRNQSRFLIESKDEYLEAIQEAGISAEVVDKINNLNTSIGLQTVDSEGAIAANAGKIGEAIFEDYRGVNVLSSFRPLMIPDLNWSILSEIDKEEAVETMSKLHSRGSMALLVIIPLVFLIAFIFSRSISKRLKYLKYSAVNLANGDLETEIVGDGKDEISSLANSFEKMRLSLKHLVEKQSQTIEDLSASMIPLTDEIGVMVLVGSVDEQRLELVRKKMTEDLAARFYKIVLVDISNVPNLDDLTSKGIIKIAKTIRLMGSKIILSGIQPSMAFELTNLQIDLNGITTQNTLQNSITQALEMIKKDNK